MESAQQVAVSNHLMAVVETLHELTIDPDVALASAQRALLKVVAQSAD